MEFAEDGGFTNIHNTRLGFECCKAGALLQCNGHEPSSHHTTSDCELEATIATEVFNPVATTCDSHTRVVGGSHEALQARTVPCSVGPFRHSRIEVSAGGSRKGASPVDSLEKARAAVVAAQEAVVRFEAELQEGLQRLEELKVAAIVWTSPPVNVVPSTLPSDHAAEVNLLQACVQELTRERDNLRARVPPQQSAATEPSRTVLAVVPTEPR